jgi:hypothetical protein
MTRKDYELIAKVLKDFTPEDGVFIERNQIVEDLAKALATENPRFDRERFLVACGALPKCDKCAKPAKLFTSRSSACSEKHAPAWVASVRATA